MVTIGDKVIYKTNGVCTVEEICKETVPCPEARNGKKERDCYLLRPLNDPGIKIYVPLDNEALVDQMRAILSPDEMLALLDQTADASMEWIDDVRTRGNAFREQLAQGDRYGLVCMLKLLYRRRAMLQANGKKLYAADETVLKRAEKLLFEEMSISLEMSYDEVALLFLTKATADPEEV